MTYHETLPLERSRYNGLLLRDQSEAVENERWNRSLTAFFRVADASEFHPAASVGLLAQVTEARNVAGYVKGHPCLGSIFVHRVSVHPSVTRAVEGLPHIEPNPVILTVIHEQAWVLSLIIRYTKDSTILGKARARREPSRAVGQEEQAGVLVGGRVFSHGNKDETMDYKRKKN